MPRALARPQPDRLLAAVTENRRGILVSAVQSIIRSRHKHLAPLHKGGSEKAGDHAEDDFLQERGVHF